MSATCKKKSILVMMSTYNGEKYIKQQIDSIMNQDVDAEVFLRIRDDGSTDTTCEIIEKLQYKYGKFIELHKGNNIGYNASFFELINSASGYDFYAISDQDDVWLKDKLKIAISRLMQKNKSTPLLYASTSWLVMDDLVPYGMTRQKKREFTIYNTLVQNICPGHTQVFNNTLLKKVQGRIDVKRIYVYDSWIANIAMLYGEILFDNEPHTYYRQHTGNQLGSGNGLVGQLASSRLKSDKGHGKKYREQICYFLQINEDEIIKQGYYNEVYKFVKSTSILARIIYCLKTKFYRQKFIETCAFRLAILLGKF